MKHVMDGIRAGISCAAASLQSTIRLSACVERETERRLQCIVLWMREEHVLAVLSLMCPHLILSLLSLIDSYFH